MALTALANHRSAWALWHHLSTPKSGFLNVEDFESIRTQNAAFLSGVSVG
ncbi:hypothetical protein GMO_23830 [Gluconobacter morbifer G707]|uniref:Uncharacterized protein n=1 Tax=Gluconobacter morbifer G707 TaxID=1088869 RepID=G6XLY3_9PROT|nr:hypothetical protein GMO_23830 [Gluconobacter morbifer G707]